MPADLEVHLIADNYHPQTRQGQSLAGPPPALPHPLHLELRQLAQYGQALVRACLGPAYRRRTLSLIHHVVEPRKQFCDCPAKVLLGQFRNRFVEGRGLILCAWVRLDWQALRASPGNPRLSSHEFPRSLATRIAREKRQAAAVRFLNRIVGCSWV